MVYEYTKEVAAEVGYDLVSCFLCTRKGRVSFSPFKKHLRKTEFYDELMKDKAEAPYLYLTQKVLVFIYKEKPLQRISYKETIGLLQMLVEKCRELKVEKLLLPINTFLIEGISLDGVLSALEQIDSEGVEIYYF